MKAKIIDGKKLAQEREEKLAKEVAVFKKEYGYAPKLFSLLLGQNPASALFVKLKEEAAARVGVETQRLLLGRPEAEKVYSLIKKANQDGQTHGILVQMPLPPGLDPVNVVAKIDPEKDVDCLTPENFGLLALGKPYFVPASVRAVLAIFEAKKIDLKGEHVVIVGAGNITGKPLALILTGMVAEGTVVVCQEATRNLSDFTRKADTLISATGVAGLIKGNMVKKGAVAIDMGSPKGDLVFDDVVKKASVVSPAPGGVGPLTVVSLLENTLLAAQRQAEIGATNLLK